MKKNIPLIQRELDRKAARELLYNELYKSPINLDEMLQCIAYALRDDYIGFEKKRSYYMPAEYKGYIMTRYRYNVLTVQMLVRSLHQLAADMHDRNVTFHCDDWIDYQNAAAIFRVRATEDALYITETQEDCPLSVGDKIVAVQKMTPPQIRKYLRGTGFFSNVPERELWGGYLRMAERVSVERKDGTIETVELPQVAARPVDWEMKFDMPDEKTAYLKIEQMDAEGFETLFSAHQSEIAEAEKLIIDLRRNVGGDEDALYPLLPYIIDKPYQLSELLDDQGSYVNCSENNCGYRFAQLKQFRAQITDAEQIAMIEEEQAFWRENRGKGLVFCPPEEIEDEVISPAENAPQKIVIIADTFCEKEGEAFVKLCQNAGKKVTVVGRPTMGTLDYTDTITLQLHKHMTFTYPIRESYEAHEGRGISEKGLSVDRYVPWTTDELQEDQLMKEALDI